MQQIASLTVWAGGGKAQLRFVFLGGLEAAGVPFVGQRCRALRRSFDAADAGLPSDVSTTVDFSCPVITLRDLFWQRSSCFCE